MATLDRSEEEVADAPAPREALVPPSPDEQPTVPTEAVPTQEHAGPNGHEPVAAEGAAANGHEPPAEPVTQEAPGANGHEPEAVPTRPTRPVRRVLLTTPHQVEPAEEPAE